MKLPSLQLKAFRATPENRCFNIFINIEDKIESLALRFILRGPIQKLKLPLVSEKPQYKEKLWESTCFELFIKEAETQKYCEWNFSPSGDWWNMFFESSRQEDPKKQSLKIESLSIFKDPENSSKLILESEIPLPDFQRPLQLGLSTVLDHGQDQKSYWALKHSESKPDFHCAKDYILKLK